MAQNKTVYSGIGRIEERKELTRNKKERFWEEG
jgi:hypothetical protein